MVTSSGNKRQKGRLSSFHKVTNCSRFSNSHPKGCNRFDSPFDIIKWDRFCFCKLIHTVQFISLCYSICYTLYVCPTGYSLKCFWLPQGENLCSLVLEMCAIISFLGFPFFFVTWIKFFWVILFKTT
jgi:hypothetical protein